MTIVIGSGLISTPLMLALVALVVVGISALLIGVIALGDRFGFTVMFCYVSWAITAAVLVHGTDQPLPD
jgi:hypothetical protein